MCFARALVGLGPFWLFVLGSLNGCDPTIHLGSWGPGQPDGSNRNDDAASRDVRLGDKDGFGSGDASNTADLGFPEPRDASAFDSRDQGGEERFDAVVDEAGGGIVWSSDFEMNDISQWTADGQGGIYQESASDLPTTVTSPAHGGMHAARITVNPPRGTMASVNYVYRQASTPVEAYYSAWFYFPVRFAARNYLNIIHFAGSTTNDDSALLSIWDVDLQSQADGSLAAYIFRFPVPNFADGWKYDQAMPLPVPIMSWVHFEVLFRKATDISGRIALWQDGTLVLDVPGVATAPTDFLRFCIGGASVDVTPAPADIFIDDAAISVARVGP